MPSADLYVVYPATREWVKAVPTDAERYITDLELMIEQLRQSESEIDRMRHDLMMDGIQKSMQRRAAMNELSLAKHDQWRQR